MDALQSAKALSVSVGKSDYIPDHQEKDLYLETFIHAVGIKAS